MRNLNCHIRHICHTAVYALELQRVAMVTDSVTDTVTDFCQSCTYATASFTCMMWVVSPSGIVCSVQWNK